MKYLNVFLLITIALISNTRSFHFSSLEEVQELKTTVFGSNLIETISMTFQDGSRADAGREVLTQLNELKNQLDSDQKNDDSTFALKQSGFVRHIENLTKEIKLLAEEIARLTAEIARLTALIAQADKNILSFNKRIANLNTLLEQMRAANEDDNKYYNRKINDLGRVYEAFTKIINTINKLKGSSSGVKKYSHINATDSEKRDEAFRRANKNLNKTAFVEVEEEEKKFMSFLQVENTESTEMKLKLSREYTAFLQSTVNADQAALAKLVKILIVIQDENLSKKSAAIAHLENINSRYQKMKVSTENEINANKVALKRQSDNRERYLAEKAKAEELRAQKEARKKLLENEKAINEQLLAGLRATYAKEKLARAEESKVVSILTRIVERRLLKKN